MNGQIIPSDSAIGAEMSKAAKTCRIIIFAGLPAAGKSLFLQQQALMAAKAGRRLHMLQWDIARGAFESEYLLAKYPEVDGVTHPTIRKAAGLWCRQAIHRWHTENAEPAELLIGEIPIAGNRFVELVQKHDDAIESLLSGPSSVFFVPVPSNEVREKLEAKREASIANPQHINEGRDAPVHTLRNIWRETRACALELGLVSAEEAGDGDAYNATVYSRLYLHMLQHRNGRLLSVDTIYPAANSAHDLLETSQQLFATDSEVTNVLTSLEATLSAEEISQLVDAWYRI